MYPRILYLESHGVYRIVFDQATHGELGHAGWQAQPIEGRRYFQVDAEGKRTDGAPLDFTRPKD